MLNLNFLFCSIGGSAMAAGSAAGYHLIVNKKQDNSSHINQAHIDVADHEVSVLLANQEASNKLLTNKKLDLADLNKQLTKLKEEEEKLTKSIDAYGEWTKAEAADTVALSSLKAVETLAEQTYSTKKAQETSESEAVTTKQAERDDANKNYEAQKTLEEAAKQKLSPAQAACKVAETNLTTKTSEKTTAESAESANKTSLATHKKELPKSVVSFAVLAPTRALISLIDFLLIETPKQEDKGVSDLLKELFEHKNAIEKHTSQLSQLKSKADSAKQAVEKAKTQLDTEKGKVVAIEKEIKEAAQKTQELKGIFDPLDSTLTTLKATLEATKSETAELLKKYEKAKSDTLNQEAIVAFYTKSATELKTKQQELMSEQTSLKNASPQTDKNRLVVIESQLAKLDSLIAISATTTNTDSKALTSVSLVTLQDLLTNNKSDISDKTKLINQINSEVIKLTSGLASLSSEISLIENERNHLIKHTTETSK